MELTLPAAASYGEGIYRRQIRLRATPGQVSGDLADDFHHFRVRLEHDGARISAAHGEAVRWPWSSCPGATEPLRALAGLALPVEAGAVAGHLDPRAHCTHLLDLAALAAALAGRSGRERFYDVAVPDRRADATRATLRRDGQVALAWDLTGNEITGPARYAGLRLLGRDFNLFCRDRLDPDEREAAWVLRRACYIAIGRRHDFDAMPGPSAFSAVIGSACHTFSPGNLEAATRMRGSARDFTHRPEALLGSDDTDRGAGAVRSGD